MTNPIVHMLRTPDVAFLLSNSVTDPVFTHTDLVSEIFTVPDSPRGADQGSVMRRLVAGDQGALGEIYDDYGRRCFALAYRLIGDRGLAEDAVQEALLALWRAPERFDAARGSLATFLLTLTHRRSVDVLRREGLQRRGRVATDDALAELPSGDRGTDEQAEVLMQGAEVREALNDLPPPQREALLLAYFQGYTQREIASITGAPLGTVKTRMLAGVRTMRTRLAGRYPSLGELR